MAEGFLGWVPAFAAVCALGLFVIGVGVMLKRQWAKRELDLLRKKYQEMDVTDPQYNVVRALYISAAVDYDRLSGADKLNHSADTGGGDSGGGDTGGGGGD